jgi:hypothetical protein
MQCLHCPAVPLPPVAHLALIWRGWVASQVGRAGVGGHSPCQGRFFAWGGPGTDGGRTPQRRAVQLTGEGDKGGFSVKYSFIAQHT